MRRALSYAVTALVVLVTPLHASRSGLNNVPTADVSAAHTGVVQAYSTVGADRKPALLSGLRVGSRVAGEHCEAGFDTRFEPGPSVPIFFNAKWGSGWEKTQPALGLGIASFAPRAADRRRLGQPQSYGVVSYETRIARLHGGYAVQARNNAFFFGVDRAWLVQGRKLTFRADVMQIQDASQWLGSAGLTYRFTPLVVFELWQSVPIKRGHAYTTGKIGWMFSL
jgi:hypothetical protein